MRPAVVNRGSKCSSQHDSLTAVTGYRLGWDAAGEAVDVVTGAARAHRSRHAARRCRRSRASQPTAAPGGRHWLSPGGSCARVWSLQVGTGDISPHGDARPSTPLLPLVTVPVTVPGTYGLPRAPPGAQEPAADGASEQ